MSSDRDGSSPPIRSSPLAKRTFVPDRIVNVAPASTTTSPTTYTSPDQTRLDTRPDQTFAVSVKSASIRAPADRMFVIPIRIDEPRFEMLGGLVTGVKAVNLFPSKTSVASPRLPARCCA